METKPKSYLKLSEAYPKIQVDLRAIKLAELIMLSRDQPKLAKAFRELRDRIELRDRQIQHREEIVDCLVTKNRDLELDVHVASIEYGRLLLGKPALTKRYAIARQLTLDIAEIL
jgi:hypothetical protein